MILNKNELHYILEVIYCNLLHVSLFLIGVNKASKKVALPHALKPFPNFSIFDLSFFYGLIVSVIYMLVSYVITSLGKCMVSTFKIPINTNIVFYKCWMKSLLMANHYLRQMVEVEKFYKKKQYSRKEKQEQKYFKIVEKIGGNKNIEHHIKMIEDIVAGECLTYLFSWFMQVVFCFHLP